MKIYLATKNNDVKDNYPAWNFNGDFKREEDKTQQQEKCIDDDGTIAENNQYILKPWQSYHLPGVIQLPVLHLNIPENNRR